MSAETAVGVFPVTVPGVAVATFPKEGVEPHWNVTVVDEFWAVTVPFNVAVVCPTGAAIVVTTIGGAVDVVKVMSFP